MCCKFANSFTTIQKTLSNNFAMRKYKFDQLWLDAIALCDNNPAEAERAVRDYIETGAEPDLTKFTPSFRAIWVLIRSQIDQRKERNARARLRRIARRESPPTATHKSSASRKPCKDTPDCQSQQKSDTLDVEGANTEPKAVAHPKTTASAVAQAPTVVVALGPSQRAQRRHSSAPHSPSRFAARFRGPSLC